MAWMAFTGLLLPVSAQEEVEVLWGRFCCAIDILLFYQLHFFEQLLGLSNLYEAVNKPVLKGDLLIQVSLYYI